MNVRGKIFFKLSKFLFLQFLSSRYPAMLFVHFDSGVEYRKYWKLFNFVSPSGDQYIVTQIVQYLRKKRHFVLWSYSIQGSTY